MQYSLEGLRPKFLTDLTRVGGAFDGGYVVNERSIHSSQYLLGLGVNDDWSFEEEFLTRKPNLRVFCFDYSVSRKILSAKIIDSIREILNVQFLLLILSLSVREVWRRLATPRHWTKILIQFSLFFGKGNAHFCPKGISNKRGHFFVTFDDAFQMISSKEPPENSVFVKMDIERSEFQVLPDLLKFQEYINGMVVEFHDLDLFWPDFMELLSTLRAHFEITHIHGNNFGGFIPNTKTPKVLEITFLKKELIQEEVPSREGITYPIPELDRPNNRLERDLPLVF